MDCGGGYMVLHSNMTIDQWPLNQISSNISVPQAQSCGKLYKLLKAKMKTVILWLL